jgi:hypothetical protein
MTISVPDCVCLLTAARAHCMESIAVQRELLAAQIRSIELQLSTKPACSEPQESQEAAQYADTAHCAEATTFVATLRDLVDSLDNDGGATSLSLASRFLAVKSQFEALAESRCVAPLAECAAAHATTLLIYQEMVTSGMYLFARLDLGLERLVPSVETSPPRVCIYTILAAGLRTGSLELVWDLAEIVSCGDVMAADPRAIHVLATATPCAGPLFEAIATGAVSVIDAWDAARALEDLVV